MGEYDGSQTELAARLRLSADGRFAYELAYGALDEDATGRWEFDGIRVLLNSDPVRAPAWVLVAQHVLAERELRIALDLPLEISPQYFNARVHLAGGQVVERQLTDDGLTFELTAGQVPVGVALRLPLYGLESPDTPLRLGAGRGVALEYRFEPNDIGKVAFAAAPLTIDQGELLLPRFDRLIRFRRAR